MDEDLKNDRRKVFHGRVHRHDCCIWYRGFKLELFLDEVNHSPTGFQWGYGGSGPAQTAYVVLRMALHELPSMTEDERIFIAKRMYQKFKQDRVTTLCIDFDFDLPVEEVLKWIELNINDLRGRYADIQKLILERKEQK